LFSGRYFDQVSWPACLGHGLPGSVVDCPSFVMPDLIGHPGEAAGTIDFDDSAKRMSSMTTPTSLDSRLRGNDTLRRVKNRCHACLPRARPARLCRGPTVLCHARPDRASMRSGRAIECDDSFKGISSMTLPTSLDSR